MSYFWLTVRYDKNIFVCCLRFTSHCSFTIQALSLIISVISVNDKYKRKTQMKEYIKIPFN